MRLGLGRGMSSKRVVSGEFDPTKLPNNTLWLDGTDSDTFNAKLASNFDKTNTEYLSSSSASLNPTGNTDFSIGFWVKKTDTMTQSIVSKWGNSSNKRQWLFRFVLDSYQFLISADGVNFTLLDGDSITATDWNFVVFVHDSVNDEIKISTNGGTFTTTAHSTGVYNAPSPVDFWVGRDESGQWFDGSIDGLFFYNKALNQSECTSLYNSGNGTAYEDLSASQLTNLTSYWSMNELSGNRIDETGTNTLTDNNTVGSILGKIQDPIENNEYVWRWYDKSGQMNHLIQETATDMPIYVSSGFGSSNRPNLTFDGVSDFIEKTGITQNQPMTIFIAGQSAGNNQTFFDGDDGTNTVKISKTATNYNVNAGNLLNGDVNNTNDVLITLVVNGGSSSIQINNATAITGNAGANVLDAFRLGKDNAGAELLNGKINTVIVYNSALDSSNIDRLKEYINTLNGIY